MAWAGFLDFLGALYFTGLTFLDFLAARLTLGFLDFGRAASALGETSVATPITATMASARKCMKVCYNDCAENDRNIFTKQ